MAARHGARCGQGCPHFGGVVGIVVVDPYTAARALEFETPGRPGEVGQGGGGATWLHAEFQRNGERGRRVEGVVPPGNVQIERKASGVGGDRHIARTAVVEHDPGVDAGAVKHNAGVAALEGSPGQRPGAGVVSAGDQHPVCREQCGEAVEGGVDGLGGAVVVQMVRFNVGHDCDLRTVIQEGTVGFVGFGDEDRCAAAGGVNSQRRNVRTDGEGRVQACALQENGDHRRRGGLSVCPGDGHGGVLRHGRGQCLGAVQHRQSGSPGGGQLRVIRADRRAGDDALSVAEVSGVIADADPGPGRGQVRHHRQVFRVGAADRQSAGHHNSGHSRHSDAADADEVDAAKGLPCAGGPGYVLTFWLGHSSIASCFAASGWHGAPWHVVHAAADPRTRSAIRRSASRMPSFSALAAIRASRSRSWSSGTM
ncbi:hypothetical protein BJQ89_01401 [Arthrobacter sp. ES1]|nr:hypothetical protein [Arthrobacter sp. ES1]